ncbi:hypothetical protein ACJMK2_006831 [Sinanodonta woodiana]|uniref:Uncharacterized protein n=1 Tax=Sinanodonta woodiana TaxID=1069815 RepID=A0ABD3VV40_SINWO
MALFWWSESQQLSWRYVEAITSINCHCLCSGGVSHSSSVGGTWRLLQHKLPMALFWWSEPQQLSWRYVEAIININCQWLCSGGVSHSSTVGGTWRLLPTEIANGSILVE